MSRLVRASPRTSASGTDDEDGRLDAALEQRARDDEAVAAVVAAAAEHRDPAIELRLVGGFDGGDDLPAGVLHQHERRDADLVDGVAIGLAHLRGGQDSHLEYGSMAVCSRRQLDAAGFVPTAYCIPPTTVSSTGGHEQNRFRSPYGLSIRPTGGQNLRSRTNGNGNAAFSRVYGCVHSDAVTAAAVCGEFLRTLSCASALPVTTSSISSRMCDHRVAEAIELGFVFALGGFDHQRAGHRERDRRRVEAVVDEPLRDIHFVDAACLEPTQIEDQLVGHAAVVA